MTDHPSRPPLLNGPNAILSDASRTAFRYANRWVVVPLHRAGLAAWLGSPLTGCQLLLTTTGRRTGLRRPTPLGYLVAEGAAWVVAGYGPSTLWYRNLVEDGRAEVLLPDRPPMAATAEEVVDPAVRARIVPPLVRSMGLPGMSIGCDPRTASDARILELLAWVPLVRITPDGPALVPGPDDPGGLAWIWRSVVATTVTVGAACLVRRAIRRGRPARRS